jgi:erythrocyte band 7 integral membrane protein
MSENTGNTGNTGGSGKALLNGANPRLEEPIIRVQPPRHEDLQPSYAKVLKPDSNDASTHSWYASMIDTLGSVIGTCGAVPCCVLCPNPYRPVQQGYVGLVTKFGRFARAVDPGLVKVNPLSEKLIAIDVKMQIVGTWN